MLDAQLKLIRALRDGLIPLGERINLTQLLALITVAAEPGLSVNELADRLGLPQQTASRHVSILLGRYASINEGERGPPLLTQAVNENDSRSRALFLTDDGARLVSELVSNITSSVERS